MELIDRYLAEVGRYLPPDRRADVLAELRLSIVETLGSSDGAKLNEEDVVRVLKETGSPKEIAALYYPEGQYLIGPALYPLFRMVVGIALFAIIGIQLVSIVISFAIDTAAAPALENFWQILGTIPAALGTIVIIFAILQRYGIRPEKDEKAFNPQDLPPIKDLEPVKRGEQIFSIIVGVVFLVILARFAYEGGFSGLDGRGFFSNPVISRYLPWIGLSLLLGILIDVLLLWQGIWQTWTRLAKIAVDLFSLVVLYLLIQGHSDWLSDSGVGGLIDGLVQLPESIDVSTQLVGMTILRMAFSIAFIIIAFEILVQLYRLVRHLLRSNKRF